MFCDSCGAQLQPGQRFCGSCGKPIGAVAPPQVAAQGRVARHLQILAVLWLAGGAINLIGGAVLFVLANSLFARLGGMDMHSHGPGFLQPLLSAVGVAVLLKALACFAAGWGLLERQSWARPLTLVLAFVSLLNIPLGTALGVYTIWVLLPADASKEYQHLSAAA